MSRVDNAIRAAVGVTVVGLAGIAGAISYSHMTGRLPWAALIAGTCASFAANIAVGGSDWIGRAVSGWPAFALRRASHSVPDRNGFHHRGSMSRRRYG